MTEHDARQDWRVDRHLPPHSEAGTSDAAKKGTIENRHPDETSSRLTTRVYLLTLCTVFLGALLAVAAGNARFAENGGAIIPH